MSIRPPAFESLVRSIARFPSVGPKSASRIGVWMLKQSEERVNDIARTMTQARRTLAPCRECFLYADKALCPICEDTQRDHRTICIVAETEDAWRIEETGEYHGLYHVLGGLLSPLDGVGIEDLTFAQLAARIQRMGETLKEIILATDFDTEGNATAAYIAESLSPQDVRTTRLAYGLPVGAELVYSDDATLAHAFSGRRLMDGRPE